MAVSAATAKGPAVLIALRNFCPEGGHALVHWNEGC